MWKKFFDVEEKQPYGVVTAYRERGYYLQRLDLFQKAISAYDESLKWHDQDIRGLLGRSLARAKATQYSGALADVAKAIEIEPHNIRAQEIQAQTEYMKCRFERALVLAHTGKQRRKCPPHFAETVSQAEETIRECTGKSARKILSCAVPQALSELKRHSIDSQQPVVLTHVSRMTPPDSHKTQEVSRVEKQRHHMISRLMASYYLERMAHDKYFLTHLCKDERLKSANKAGSEQLQQLANKALDALEVQQTVLRTRRPLYATRAAGAEARKRLGRARRERLQQARDQHMADAERLVKAAQAVLEERDTAKCLENAEFALDRISRKPPNLLPKKEKYLLEIYDIVANAFLDQVRNHEKKRVRETMSEADREKRAFILLGLALSREPSQDSMLRVQPLAPPRDVKQRLQKLERALKLSARPAERCYILHELARHYLDTKQIQRARFYTSKCQGEARLANKPVWLLNASFLLAKSHIMQNNRPEARAILLECKSSAKAFGYANVSQFFDTCADVSTEGELASEKDLLEKREQDMVNLMQDDDMKSAAQHLFRRMSAVPAARRFSVMPGAKTDETTGPPQSVGRRQSIMPRAQEPTRVMHKSKLPLGFQEFDL